MDRTEVRYERIFSSRSNLIDKNLSHVGVELNERMALSSQIKPREGVAQCIKYASTRAGVCVSSLSTNVVSLNPILRIQADFSQPISWSETPIDT